MQKLIDSGDDYKTIEKKVIKYIKSLTNKEIKTIHENLEYTPFTWILQKEYQRRFSNL